MLQAGQTAHCSVQEHRSPTSSRWVRMSRRNARFALRTESSWYFEPEHPGRPHARGWQPWKKQVRRQVRPGFPIPKKPRRRYRICLRQTLQGGAVAPRQGYAGAQDRRPPMQASPLRSEWPNLRRLHTFRQDNLALPCPCVLGCIVKFVKRCLVIRLGIGQAYRPRNVAFFGILLVLANCCGWRGAGRALIDRRS
jgi:hypothetical protein